MKLDSLLDEKGYIEIIDVQVHYRLLLLPHYLTLHQSKNTFDENFPHSLHTCAKKKKKKPNTKQPIPTKIKLLPTPKKKSEEAGHSAILNLLSSGWSPHTTSADAEFCLKTLKT